MPQQIDPTHEAHTSIDSLLELLKEKGKADLNTISITLGVSPTIVEEWARVLENGKLIRVSYEVGKMYLEPVTETVEQGRTASIKVDAQRSALQNEMEVERITLDKYDKNLQDLSTTVAGMEALYKQRLPNIQKLFADLDAAAAPMAKKTKEMEETRKMAESYFSQLDKKVDELYNKMNSMEGANVERMLKQKEETLKVALSRADAAKATLLDLEDTKQALYTKLSNDIDQQVKDFKAGLKASINQIYAELKTDAADAVNVDREIKTELVETSKIANEAERMRKETDSSRNALMTARNGFKDKYAKTADEIEKAANTVTQRYTSAQQQLNELKASIGEVSKLHDSLQGTKGEIEAIQKQISIQKTSVDGIIDTLRTLNATKELDPGQKAKAMNELNKKSLSARLKGEKINRSINEVETSLHDQAEIDTKA
jgi:myosin heavy subunit